MSLQPMRFTMDLLGAEVYLDGFSDGQTWNGWDRPLFTFDQAMKVLDAFNNVQTSQNTRIDAKYDAEKDVFCFLLEPEGEFECFDSIIIDGHKLYPIGAGSWIWEHAEKWD